MESKTYGLDTLALILAGRTGTTDERRWADEIEQAVDRHYSMRDDGLWRVGRNAVGAAPAHLDVLDWQPVASNAQPALPVPFTAYEFAAFTLAGFGVFVIEQFEGLNDEEDLNESELAALGRNGDAAREVLRESSRLRLEAYRQQRIDDGRDEDKQPRDADAAAAWLLSDAHQETAIAMLKIAEVAPGPNGHMPVQRAAAQDAEILDCLRKCGHDPLDLRPNTAGIAGVKAETRKALRTRDMWAGSTVFDKAWERLSRDGAIAYRK